MFTSEIGYWGFFLPLGEEKPVISWDDPLFPGVSSHRYGLGSVISVPLIHSPWKQANSNQGLSMVSKIFFLIFFDFFQGCAGGRTCSPVHEGLGWWWRET